MNFCKIIVLLSCVFWKLNAQKQRVFYDKELDIIPVLKANYSSNIALLGLGEFQKKIKEKTGVFFPVSKQSQANRFTVSFQNATNNLVASVKGNQISVYGKNKEEFKKSINKLFKVFSFIDAKIVIENDTLLRKENPNKYFSYREVYFKQNFEPENREIYDTHFLEDSWAIWGHNLHKLVIKKECSNAVFASVNGKKVKEQLCFSSPELERLIVDEIEKRNQENSTLKKYTLAPVDNTMVCTCKLCKQKGNTNKSASPAVFNLIKKMALQYPNLSFWGLGYTTTKSIPRIKLPKNTGVLLSTIDCQNAIPLKETIKGRNFLNKITAWKKQIGRVYIWDYVVNFDNYFDFFPILKTSQINLKSYYDKGVKGVFFQGSGYQYSVVEDVKYAVLSNLLKNPNKDVDNLIKEAVKTYHPDLIGVLDSYLIKIENRALNSKIKQSIYSSTALAKKRYLNYKELNELLSKKEKKLNLSLLYLQVEIMRTNSLNSNYAYAKKVKKRLQVVPLFKKKLSQLSEWSKRLKINRINERDFTIRNYVVYNKELIRRIKTKNRYIKYNKLSSPSTLDEGYRKLTILNDGLFGSKQYNDNWLLFSGNKLDLNFEKKMNLNTKGIEISFLIDKTHGIYLPQKIELIVGNKIENVIVPKDNSELKLTVKSIVLAIKDKLDNIDNFRLKIYNSHKSIAVDEVRCVE